MSYSNHYKSKISDSKKSKSKKKSKKDTGFIGKTRERINVFLSDDRTRNITGLIFMLGSAVLLLALTSYLFTWKTDQDELFNRSWWNIWLDPSIEIENWLGTFGALLSHQLINNGFGVASFVFVLISFLIGFRILFRV